MLSQQGGGIGTLGPGEKKLEIDRRRIEERVDRLRKEIEEIRQHRGVLRKKREKENVKICSLVGYTNAGKSTLFNALAQSHEKTADSLFTTLDTVSNTFNLKDNLNAVIADTVGFIHKLPPHLVDAFKATLEELEHADLIIHIIDVSSPDIKRLKQSVDAMLSELGLLEKPILLVFNKIDKAGAEENLWLMGKDYPNAVSISALNGTGLDILKEKIFEIIFQEMKQAEIKLSFQQMELANYVHKTCEIIKKEYSEKEIVFSVRAKESNLAYLKKNGAQVNEI
jgi:GTP-binding protein HflX